MPRYASDGEETDDSYDHRDEKYWSRVRGASSDARKLFDNDAFADITIKYGSRSIRAHRVILSIRSRWFREAFAKDMQSKVRSPQLHRRVIPAIADVHAGRNVRRLTARR